MSFTTIKISPAKLNEAIKAKKFSKADFERRVGASRESVLKWTNERRREVGMKPEYFRKALEVLDVAADAIEMNGSDRTLTVDELLAEAKRLIAAAAETGMSDDEILRRLDVLSEIRKIPGVHAGDQLQRQAASKRKKK